MLRNTAAASLAKSPEKERTDNDEDEYTDESSSEEDAEIDAKTNQEKKKEELKHRAKEALERLSKKDETTEPKKTRLVRIIKLEEIPTNVKQFEERIKLEGFREGLIQIGLFWTI
jgi:hypothetical protein